jgi:hypothetical protein
MRVRRSIGAIIFHDEGDQQMLIKNSLSSLGFLAAMLWIYACAAPGLAWAETAYYQGKTLTNLRGGTPGGYGDLQARALIPFLKKYIPGEPTVIIEHKQGAAGRTAINYIYSGAKPDGLTIGAVGNVLVSGPTLGLAGSNYDLDKLINTGWWCQTCGMCVTRPNFSPLPFEAEI